MNLAKVLPFFGLVIALSGAPAFAHEGPCEPNLLIQQARSNKWLAQRQQIQYLEKQGESFKNLSRAYRSLVQDLFNADAGERTRVILLVLPGRSILSQLDLTLPAQRFTEDLIRVMGLQMSQDAVLKKLRAFADLEQDKLSGY